LASTKKREDCAGDVAMPVAIKAYTTTHAFIILCLEITAVFWLLLRFEKSTAHMTPPKQDNNYTVRIGSKAAITLCYPKSLLNSFGLCFVHLTKEEKRGRWV